MLKYAQQFSHRGKSSPLDPYTGDWLFSSTAAKGATVTPHNRPEASRASVSNGKRETVALTAMVFGLIGGERYTHTGASCVCVKRVRLSLFRCLTHSILCSFFGNVDSGYFVLFFFTYFVFIF